MMLTVSRMPVPDPIAPKKSAKIVRIPMHMPPNVAASITKFFIFWNVPSAEYPRKNIPCSFKLAAISLGPCPETSTHVRLNRAQPTISLAGTSDDEGGVDDGVNGISDGFEEGPWRSDVVNESSNRHELSLHACFLPVAEKVGDEGTLEIPVQHLREEVEVGDEGSLQDDGDVGSVEESNRVGGFTGGFVVGQTQGDFEALEVDDDHEDQDGGQHAADVGEFVPEEGILNCSQPVASEDESVEQLDDGPFVLFSESAVG